MKIRNGWVGNSSSSSFIIQFDKKIETTNIKSWLIEHIKDKDLFLNLDDKDVLTKLFDSFTLMSPERYYSLEQYYMNYNLLTNRLTNEIYSTKSINDENRQLHKYCKYWHEHFRPLKKRKIKIENKYFVEYELLKLRERKWMYFSEKPIYLFEIGDETKIGDIYLISKKNLDGCKEKLNEYPYPLDDLYKLNYFGLDKENIICKW